MLHRPPKCVEEVEKKVTPSQNQEFLFRSLLLVPTYHRGVQHSDGVSFRKIDEGNATV